MKKVLIITYYWPPAGGAGVQRWLKFSKYLPEYGWQPIVLTVDPEKGSYPQRDDSLFEDVSDGLRVIRTNTFEPLKIYSALFRKKELPYGGFANQKSGIFSGIMRFIRGNFFIPDARIGWKNYAFSAARKLIESEGIEKVITTSPPHSTQLIGLKLKKVLNIQWIADLRDPWTDIYFYDELYHLGVVRRIDKRLEKKVLQKADSIITVSHSLASLFRKKILGTTEKIRVIPNGFDPDDFESGIAPSGNRDEFIITYTGTMSARYDIRGFAKALKRILSDYPVGNFKLTFVGTISPAVEANFNEPEFKGVLVKTPYLPHKESIQYLVKSDALLLVIPDSPDNKGILTGKLFEYLAVQKPIIGIGPIDGDAARVVEEAKAGRFFSTSDTEGMYEYLQKLIEKWNQGNRSLTLDNQPAIKQYSRIEQAKVLSNLLADTTAL